MSESFPSVLEDTNEQFESIIDHLKVEALGDEVLGLETPFGINLMTEIRVDRSDPLCSDAPDSFSNGLADDKKEGSDD